MLRALQAAHKDAQESHAKIGFIIAVIVLLIVLTLLILYLKQRNRKRPQQLKSTDEIATPSEQTQTTVSPKTSFTDGNGVLLLPRQSIQTDDTQKTSELYASTGGSAMEPSNKAGILLCDLRSSAFRNQHGRRAMDSTLSRSSSVGLSSESSIVRPSQVATAAAISAGLRLVLDEYSQHDVEENSMLQKRYFGSMSSFASDTSMSFARASIASSVPEDCDIYDGQFPSSASLHSGVLHAADLRVSTEF